MKLRPEVSRRRQAIAALVSQLALLANVGLSAGLSMPANATDKGVVKWRAVQDKNLRIGPGNPLDFSSMNEPGPAGKHGWIIARPDGHLVFANDPGKRRRFLCASQPYGVEEGFPGRETADQYAEQLRLHGYNVARFHFVENVLMNGRTGDFDFDPEQLERFHYFLFALKRAGIYWIFDVLTSWNGAYGDVGPDRWADRRNVKLGVYLSASDRDHWRKLVDKLLAAPNKHTGMSPLNDPALLGIVTVNEGGLNNLIALQPSPELDKKFAAWLARKYGSERDAVSAWGAEAGSRPIALPRDEYARSAKVSDAQQFYFELQSETQKWMTDYLRGLGYAGLITGFESWFTLQDIATRGRLGWVTGHAYHDLSNGFVQPGTAIAQSSSLGDAVPYIRDLAISRYWSKPFSVTEHDQPFWNKYRYESGLAIGAYASLQDWSLICRHSSGPIELEYGGSRGDRHRMIYPFGIGTDPVARVGETLAALLFLREDVRPAMRRVTVRLMPDYVFAKRGGIEQMPAEISRIGLVTGLGLEWDGGDDKNGRSSSVSAKADLVIDPAKEPPLSRYKWMRRAAKILNNDVARWHKSIADLKEAGVLPPGNESDAKSGVLQSDTGEIVLNETDGALSVATVRTEAVAFGEKLPGGLPHLTVKESGSPALLAASSLDGKPIEQSARILLVFATDARNSGMKFSNASERVLRSLGSEPVLIKAARARIALRHAHPEKLRLYALRLNGERSGELPLTRDKNGVDLVLDTVALPDGPTTFFELAY